MDNKYLFQSDRLGFRNWTDADLPLMAAINADPEIMEFFPSVQSSFQTHELIERMKAQFAENRYCYFAVEKLDTGNFIGFIGLFHQTFPSDFTPTTDVGWRLAKDFWGKGFATEGAKACLKYGFEVLSLQDITSVAPVVNVKSIAVMTKLGMKWQYNFLHPKLEGDERLQLCALYSINRRDFFKQWEAE